MTIQVVIQPWTETNVEEGYIANWFARSGDAVRAGQALGELMVEKANSEITAPQDGVVQKVFIKRGDVVKPGAVVAEIALVGEMAAAPPVARAEFTPASPAARRLAREQGGDLAQVTLRMDDASLRRMCAAPSPLARLLPPSLRPSPPASHSPGAAK